MRRLYWVLGAPLLLLASSMTLAACATDIDQGDYARNCSAASECRLIFQGPACSCGCDYGAINAADYDTYLADSDVECNIDCAPCPNAVAECSDSVCVVAP